MTAVAVVVVELSEPRMGLSQIVGRNRIIATNRSRPDLTRANRS